MNLYEVSYNPKLSNNEYVKWLWLQLILGFF